MTWLALALTGLAAGLAASGHCLAMCGCFPLAVARGPGRGRLLARLGLYLLGKLVTYTFFGSLAGLLGALLTQAVWLPVAQRGLAWLSGAILLVAGLRLLVPRRQAVGCPNEAVGLFAPLLRAPSPSAAFTLGLLNGFLPCPITAAMLLAAATTHSVLAAMVLMASLAVGTAPALLGIGLSGGWLGGRLKRFGAKPAALVLIALGLITIVRGTSLLHHHHPPSPAQHHGGPHH